MWHDVKQHWTTAYKEAPLFGRLQILYLLALPVFVAWWIIHLTQLWSQL